jgi:hypothetical protein
VGVEVRKGRIYLYDRRRVGGRLVGSYIGPVPPDGATLIRRQAEIDRAEWETRRRDREAVRRRAAEVLSAGAAFDRVADRVFRAVMALTGHALHHRSEWRRRRGEPAMAKLPDLLNPKDEPAPALVRAAAPDPAAQKVLDRAAAGDRSVLPAVRELLKNPAYLTALGSVAGLARDALVRMAAGDDLAIAEAVRRKLDETITRLLADGPGDPSFAERMAATRVAHNWLCVHILEALMARWPAGGERSAAIDRQLCRAERRLQASLKALAALRRLHRPTVVAQVNVANGPMQVNNGPAQSR